MCRVLGYLGGPVSLEGILYETDSALARALGDRFQLRYFSFSSGAEPIPDARGMTWSSVSRC